VNQYTAPRAVYWISAGVITSKPSCNNKQYYMSIIVTRVYRVRVVVGDGCWYSGEVREHMRGHALHSTNTRI